MNIMKAQNEDEDWIVAEALARAFVEDMKGVKTLIRGSAVLWLETMSNNIQTANAMKKHGLHDVEPTGEDKEVFLASL